MYYDDAAFQEFQLIVRFKQAYRDYEDVRWHAWLEGVDWLWPRVKDTLLSKFPLPELPDNVMDSRANQEQFDQAVGALKSANRRARRSFRDAEFTMAMRSVLWMAVTVRPHPHLSEAKQLDALNETFGLSLNSLSGAAQLGGYNQLRSLLESLSLEDASALRPWLRFIEPNIRQDKGFRRVQMLAAAQGSQPEHFERPVLVYVCAYLLKSGDPIPSEFSKPGTTADDR